MADVASISTIGVDNLYVPLGLFKRHIGVSSTTYDTRLAELLYMASREAESPENANTVFYTKTEARYYNCRSCLSLLVDQVLSISELAEDTAEDGTFATTWAASDYTLCPYNTFPKHELIPAMGGDYLFTPGQRRYKVTGTWGYGDGKSASPWISTGLTATVADTTSATITTGGVTGIDVGQTVLVESEQMFVTGYGTTTITVVRGVNGTTAAAHSSKALSIAQYPGMLLRAVTWFASEAWNTVDRAGLDQITIGDWQSRMRPLPEPYRSNLLNSVRRIA